MTLLSDADNTDPPPNRSHMRWLDKLALSHPEWVEEFRTLVRGWRAGTLAQKYRTKNALAKFIAAHKDTPVRVGLQTITKAIEEVEG